MSIFTHALQGGKHVGTKCYSILCFSIPVLQNGIKGALTKAHRSL